MLARAQDRLRQRHRCGNAFGKFVVSRHAGFPLGAHF
jgi:hypothetical protein